MLDTRSWRLDVDLSKLLDLPDEERKEVIAYVRELLRQVAEDPDEVRAAMFRRELRNL